jgi:hypothetical protein
MNSPARNLDTWAATTRTRPTGLHRPAPADLLLRAGIAVALTVSGYLHAKLYLDGYRFVHVIGDLFLVQASVSFPVALLVLIGAPVWVRVIAAGVAGGALIGFVLSRTIGVFGFTERGWQPAPDSLLSVLAESAALVLLVPTLLLVARLIGSGLSRRK